MDAVTYRLKMEMGNNMVSMVLYSTWRLLHTN